MLPKGVAGTEPKGSDVEEEASAAEGGPVMNRMMKMDGEATEVWQKKCRSWTRSKGKISEGGGRRAHLNALAYMSDSYFIGTVSRVHRLWRFPFRPSAVPSLPASKRKIVEEDACLPEDMSLQEWEDRPEVGMQVSLDHSIYFHEPRRVMADEWMFVEMESPWAGDGRGVVIQRVWSRDGTLLATCMQEVSLFLRTVHPCCSGITLLTCAYRALFDSRRTARKSLQSSSETAHAPKGHPEGLQQCIQQRSKYRTASEMDVDLSSTCGIYRAFVKESLKKVFRSIAHCSL